MKTTTTTSALSLCNKLGLEHSNGMIDTPLAGVRLLKLEQHEKATPHIYQQSINYPKATMATKPKVPEG
ncbi:MAG: hypothetical protein ACI8WB_004904 [Phenylobacterium sp.]|jgi:hypothetical protein